MTGKSSKKDSKDLKKGDQSIISLDEFNFPHGVYLYDASHLKDDVLISGYTKLH